MADQQSTGSGSPTRTQERRGLRAVIGWWLRCLADRVDRDHAFVAFPGHWNHTRRGIAVTVRDGYSSDGAPGVDLWFRSSDYDRAWIGYDEGDPVSRFYAALRNAEQGRTRFMGGFRPAVGAVHPDDAKVSDRLAQALDELGMKTYDRSGDA